MVTTSWLTLSKRREDKNSMSEILKNNLLPCCSLHYHIPRLLSMVSPDTHPKPISPLAHRAFMASLDSFHYNVLLHIDLSNPLFIVK